MAETLYVHLLGSRAILPQQQGFSNVYVLFAPENYMIAPRGCVLLSLQLAFEIPVAYTGRLYSMADMNTRGVLIGAQELNPSVFWEVSVVLFNHSDDYFYGVRGQPVACLLLQRVIFPQVLQASLV